jgi:CRP-like cAMP-binding protein
MTVSGHDQAPMAPTGNRILDSLPPADRAQVLPKLTLLQLPYGQQLYGLGARVTHVYFPRTALISELVVLSDGRQIEVAAIGRHGFLGLRVAMGVEVETLVSVTQVPGEAWAMEATEFQAALAALPGLRRLVAAYSVVRFIQVAQFAACHALHSLRQRCARTLLEVSDQVGADDFFITQRFLAAMLGVHRPSVTVALRRLQWAGLISSRRGRIRIRHRAPLVEMACECYRFIIAETNRLLGEAAGNRQ